jgi:hypothetical protein
VGNKKSTIPKEYGIFGFGTSPKRRIKATGGSLHPLETSKIKILSPLGAGFFVF